MPTSETFRGININTIVHGYKVQMFLVSYLYLNQEQQLGVWISYISFKFPLVYSYTLQTCAKGDTAEYYPGNDKVLH